MDFQRILILLGLAITTYMLILAWIEDYGSGRIESESADAISTPNTDILTNINSIPSASQNGPFSEASVDFLPLDSIKPEPVLGTTSDVMDLQSNSQNARYVTVTTDVLNLLIDTVGGDIVKASLKKFPVAIDQPDSPFVLMDPRNAYAAQSGLIGPNGTDTAAGRPIFTVAQSQYELSSNEDQIQVELKTLHG